MKYHYCSGRESFVELGVSQCAETNALGACGASTLGAIEFDAGNIYAAQGVVAHPDGQHLLMAYAAYPFGDYGITRAPAGGNASNWRKNNGVGLLRTRVDGFAHIEAPHSGMLHTFTTVPLRVSAAKGLTVEINFAAAVEGTVQVELLDAKTSQPIPNYTRADSEPLFGNFVRRKARWGRPQHWESTARVRASAVQLAVHFRNAKVYSLLALNSDSGQSQS